MSSADELQLTIERLTSALTASVEEREKMRKDVLRMDWFRRCSSYRNDCGQLVLDFDAWVEVTDVDEPSYGESRPTPPDRFNAAIDSAIAQLLKDTK